MDDYSFAMQQRTFDVHGYALNPSTSGEYRPIVGSLNNAHQNGYSSIDGMRSTKSMKREAKRKRAEKGDAGVVDGDGAYMGPWASYEAEKEEVVIEEEAEEWREEKRRREEAKEAAQEKMRIAREEKSIFHGKLIVVSKCCANGKARSCTIMLDGRTCTYRQIQM